MIAAVLSMKRLILIFLALIGLSACSYEISPELKPYVNEFKSYCKQYSHCKWPERINVVFVYKLGVNGRCSQTPFSKAVMIDIDYWERSLEYNRERVTFHEFGHCVLGREHVTYLSYMRSKLGLSENEYWDSRDLLIEELFLD